MKVMIRKTTGGALSLYMPKKDLEERIVAMEKEKCGAAQSRWVMAGSWSCRTWRPTRGCPSPSKCGAWEIEPGNSI